MFMGFSRQEYWSRLPFPSPGNLPDPGIKPWFLTSPAFASRLVAQRLKRLPAMQETGFDPWVGKIPWRRKWQPTPVFLPGESRRRRSLEGYGPRGHKELDMTEQLHFHFSLSLPLAPYAFFKKPFRTIVPDLFGTRD